MTNINLANQGQYPRVRLDDRINPENIREEKNKTSSKWPKVLLTLVVILILGGAGYWFLTKFKTNDFSYVVDRTKFQAVFLVNGQTYFGKVTNEFDQYLKLDQVYYLILKQPLQNQSEVQDLSQDLTKTTVPEYSIIKLGRELHGPTSMAINRDQVLFIENLGDESKVVSAIKQGK